ncbi:hypothetical protein EMIHUDRAFT_226453 [Emiliania huxleyi CCMP1516]|uniref:Uncharacterized protein n=2 Tax=Emiliania huxleyi TaxID=2903 RepID=A0A0D3KKX7_EMIH1|nr:hypothetical protein EMIHUDRAFT_226453 [Emiliania huxleyi CCMP1516]EOD36412.1 hypothetical protein EMIHUDRAFT_226453 [Emiliania huxleyi CCMP1516]|eukprot:XP_005788841.1 hypothetical protein EMIHUDRAFT_226453 [Emiliania huxleyi CCMP1516]
MKLILAIFGALLPPTSASAQTTFADKPDLQNATDLWCSNETAALATYGNITDMKCLFSASLWCVSNGGGSTTGKRTCNPDIGSWVTSAVTTMVAMFEYATSFDKDISSWNTSAVLEMAYTFRGASSFDKDIGSWDTSAVLDMQWMFANASSFDKDLSSWNVSAATDMALMFDDASSLSDCNKALIQASFAAQTSAWEYSSATVQRADGETALLSSLSAGDAILAAAADGTLTFDGVRALFRLLLLGTLGFDVVSSFSLADLHTTQVIGHQSHFGGLLSCGGSGCWVDVARQQRVARKLSEHQRVLWALEGGRRGSCVPAN